MRSTIVPGAFRTRFPTLVTVLLLAGTFDRAWADPPFWQVLRSGQPRPCRLETP